MAEKIRLGGMALANGVLVHGPTAWACAIRREDGTLEVAAERKRFQSDERTPPFLRGPLKLLESLAVLPSARRALPEARLPFERKGVLAALVASAAGVRAVRSSRLGPATQELVSALFSFAPAMLAFMAAAIAEQRGGQPAYLAERERQAAWLAERLRA